LITEATFHKEHGICTGYKHWTNKG